MGAGFHNKRQGVIVDENSSHFEAGSPIRLLGDG